MNQFLALDNLYPCGADRFSGEVVCVHINVFAMPLGEGSNSFSLSAKRKQWYVNASVNAWHLHRALCRELSVAINASGNHDAIPSRQLREAKSLLARAVEYSYRDNHATDTQFYEFDLVLGLRPFYAVRTFHKAGSAALGELTKTGILLPNGKSVPYSWIPL